MKKTVKIRYREYEMMLVPITECGIETWIIYVDFGGMSKRGAAMSLSGAITIGKNYINQIAV